MSSFERWGRFIARQRRIVLGGWLLAVAGALVLIPTFLANVEGVGIGSPGSDSDRAAELQSRHTGAQERAPLVISSQRVEDLNADFREAVREVVAVVRGIDHVRRVIPPSPSDTSHDGRTVVATVLLSGSEGDRQQAAEDIQQRVDRAAPDGVTADLTGPSALFADLIRVEESDVVKAEAVGIPIAGIVLLLAFGTVVAAGLPLLVAIAGLTFTFGLLGLVSIVSGLSVFIENVVVMVGLGVGIDYALLIVRRFREERQHSADADALATTMATAGRTVAFSGMTVVMTLIPLFLAGHPFFNEIALGAMLVVVVMILGALTLVPALLATLGGRIERLRVPIPTPRGGAGWIRWTEFVMRRPWPVLVAALLVLGLMAAPVLGMKTGLDLGARAYPDEPSARGLSALERAFPGSALSPVTVVVAGPDRARLAVAERRAAALLKHTGRVTGIRVAPLGPSAVVIAGSPTIPPDSSKGPALVSELRADLDRGLPRGTESFVGGTIAETFDFDQTIKAGIPWVVGGALLLCFMVLLVVFRSPFLALKAVLANLLSIAASFGLVVLVFQEGFGENVLGFSSAGYLQSYMPLTLFVLIYGLSMDYEVFIVSRIREEWQRNGGDTAAAIAVGLQRTGGVVTSAAAIMVAVFLAFTLARVPEIKQFGFGLGIAIAIDATIVRAALVPAAMRIAGRWNWWEPKLMTRILDRNRKPEPELAVHL